MKWKDACDEARELLGYHGYVCSDRWEEIVEMAKDILSNYREEEYLEYCHNIQSYYDNYINSKSWFEKRKLILIRDKHRCFDCGGVACMVHHFKYDNLGKADEEKDCISVCASCHTIRHSKTDMEKNSRLWFSRTINGYHTVMYCPHCFFQRTWTTLRNRNNVFVCDHCKLKLVYDKNKDNFRVGGF
jgi:hypothetical protein